MRRVSCGLNGWVRTAVAGALCGLLVEQPLMAQATLTQSSMAVVDAHGMKPMQPRERPLHALNRLTFGARPGDIDAVQEIGLNRWFEQQLNPASIDDSDLEARLAEYPAMQMPVAELESRYPGPQVIRQMIAGKIALPSDPTQRAVVEDQIALYKMQKARQEAKAPAMQDPMGDAQAGTAMAGSPEKAVPASELAPEPMTLADGDAHTAGSSRGAALKLIALPPDQRMQTILAMPVADLGRVRQALRGGEQAQLIAGLSPRQKETLLALGGSLRMVATEEMESRVERDIYSKRQLEAVMTDFWLNHFNVYVRKNQNEAYLIPTYERETIRPHALGNFEDLLVATAESPAMLEYLDNFRSVGPDSEQVARIKQFTERHPGNQQARNASAGLNENYGRELMELHTLGVNGGYTQADVTNVAKVFTGWGLDKPYQGGGFVFDERKHEPGSKLVLGRTIAFRGGENGMKEGLEVLHMLAQSPATAHFLSEKLAVRFVSDTPPPALVDRMAASYMASHGDIKTVLRTMWTSPEFWSANVYRAKVKTPEEFVISAVRASGAEVSNPAALVQAMAKLGMPLYGMQTPNGYSWKQDDWVSTGALVSRMNFALVLSGDRVPGMRTVWMHVLGEAGRPETRSGMEPAAYSAQAASVANSTRERRLEMALIGQPVGDRTRAAVLSQANDGSVTEQAETRFDLRGGGGGKGQGISRQGRAQVAANGVPDDAQAAVMAGLLLGSPEFQRR